MNKQTNNATALVHESSNWVANSLLNSRKCCHLNSDFLQRMAFWASERHKSKKEALKAAKRKIHQVYGAYVINSRNIAKAHAIVAKLPEHPSAIELCECCREILTLHTSSKERLEQTEEIFKTLWAITGIPTSIIDIACGLNPFALPWMHLPSSSHYKAIDIDYDMTKLIANFFSHYNPKYKAKCCDVVTTLPTEPVETALFLKAYPCFEQQQKGSGLTVLKATKAKNIVLSFPAKSLSGKQIGMESHYARLAQQIVKQLDYEMEFFKTENELFYILFNPNITKKSTQLD